MEPSTFVCFRCRRGEHERCLGCECGVMGCLKPKAPPAPRAGTRQRRPAPRAKPLKRRPPASPPPRKIDPVAFAEEEHQRLLGWVERYEQRLLNMLEWERKAGWGTVLGWKRLGMRKVSHT